MTTTMLFTGATGTTGHYTSPLLIARVHRVRAFVHRLDWRLDTVAGHGAEIVTGDLLQEAIGRAMAGSDAASSCYPVESGLLGRRRFSRRLGVKQKARPSPTCRKFRPGVTRRAKPRSLPS